MGLAQVNFRPMSLDDEGEKMHSSRIAIVGSGALGQFYGAQFCLAGHSVRFVARRDSAVLRDRGLRITQTPTPDIASSLKRRNLILPPSAYRVCTSGFEASQGGIDWCLLALKTTGLSAARELCAPLVASGARVVVCCNGLGVEDACATWCPPAQIWGMICSVGINRDADGTVRHLALGRVAVGHYLEDSTRREELGRLCDSVGIARTAPSCLLEARWRKIAWNLPFNGLSVSSGGVSGLDTAAILADCGLRRRAEKLIRETIRIANADLAEHGRPERIDEDEWTAEQFRLTPPMGPYLTSTLLDWRAGRPLESDALFVEPLRRAHLLGVQAPELERLVTEISARAQSTVPGSLRKAVDNPGALD
jgi:2-dehydropantoate 2-reductase